LKIITNHPQEISKLKDKIQNLPSVEDVREYDIPIYRRYLIDNGLFPMSSVEVEGKILNSHRSSSKTCIFEIYGLPHNVKSSLPNLNILCFNIEVCNPHGMPEVEKILSA